VRGPSADVGGSSYSYSDHVVMYPCDRNTRHLGCIGEVVGGNELSPKLDRKIRTASLISFTLLYCNDDRRGRSLIMIPKRGQHAIVTVIPSHHSFLS